MPPQIVTISSLDWPESPSDLPNATISRCGQSFLSYDARARGWLKRPAPSASGTSASTNSPTSTAAAAGAPSSAQKAAAVDLFSLSEEELSELSYYEVLGGVPMHCTAEALKKYYRKACLRYHPDKTGRGEEDAVFLAVKAAFETLSDPAKKKAYDSTLDFDDSIPAGGESPEEFYKAYGPVFERNLRFDRRYDPSASAAPASGKKKGGKGGKKKNRGGKSTASAQDDEPPSLGDDSTPIGEVHNFYDYWTHFESWRDFTLKAQASTDHDMDMADSRDEARWMKKEIDRKAKALKREEVARIALLVERAMGADPRLRREREREKEEKKRQAEEKERKRIEKEKEEAEEKVRKEKQEQERAAKEKEERAAAKAKKDQEKKQLRKAKQLLWKLAVAAHGKAKVPEKKVWSDIESMHDDIDVINDNLGTTDILALVEVFGGPGADGDVTKVKVAGLAEVKRRCDEIKGVNIEKEKAEKEKRDRDRAAAAEKEALAKAGKECRPWTKKELSALAKAVKKYPPGGANRWDAIALFVNNLCKQKEGPRSREECIERYNIIAQNASAAHSASGGGAAATNDGDVGEDQDDAWTEKQDKFLQNGLAKYTARTYPDKNERWGLIADMVPGKSKKECVNRFKEIREALKKKKKGG